MHLGMTIHFYSELRPKYSIFLQLSLNSLYFICPLYTVFYSQNANDYFNRMGGISMARREIITVFRIQEYPENIFKANFNPIMFISKQRLIIKEVSYYVEKNWRPHGWR